MIKNMYTISYLIQTVRTPVCTAAVAVCIGSDSLTERNPLEAGSNSVYRVQTLLLFINSWRERTGEEMD